MAKSNLGWVDVYLNLQFICYTPSLTEAWAITQPEQGRNLEAKLKQRLWRSAAYGLTPYRLVPHVWINLLYYRSQDL